MAKFDKKFFSFIGDEKHDKLVSAFEKRHKLKAVSSSGFMQEGKDTGFGWIKYFTREIDWSMMQNLNSFLCNKDGTVLVESYEKEGDVSFIDIKAFIDRISGVAKQETVDSKDENEAGYKRVRKALINAVVNQPELIKHIPASYFVYDKSFAQEVVDSYELDSLGKIIKPDSPEGRKELVNIKATVEKMKKIIEKDIAQSQHQSGYEKKDSNSLTGEEDANGDESGDDNEGVMEK